MASAFALAASLASAEPERPRIYYPRAIKRQIGNITSDELPEPASTTTIESSTRRGLLDDLLDGVIGGDSTSTSRSRETTTDEDEDEDETSKGGGIIIGPTGIKIPGLEPSTKSSSSDATPTRAPSTSSESASKSASKSSDDDDETSSAGSSSSSTKLIDLDPIITNILPDPTTTNATDDDTPSSTVNSGSGSSSVVTPSSSSSSGLIDDLTSLLPPPATETSEPAETSTSGSDDGEVSSASSSEPAVTPTPVPPPTTSSEIPSSTLDAPIESSSSGPPPLDTPTIPATPSASEASEAPATNTTEAEPTSEPTDVEVPTSASASVSESSTQDEPAATPTSADETEETEAPASTPEEAPTTFTKVAPTKKPAETTAAEPTKTGNPEDDWLPSTIVQEATSFSFTRPTAEPTGTATSMPSNVPKVILSNEPEVKQPEDTTAIQIGFLYPLNWGFVSKNTVAAAQVFRYLPEALATAGGFPSKNVVVTKLIPMDTNHKWGFTTTIATLWYPTASLDGLQMQLNAANSRLYNNDKDIINSLTAVINKNIDLFGNIGGENGDANHDDDEGGNGGDDTFDDNDNSGTSAQDRARTAGIAVGALSLAGLYGAAMFIVARRYKRKRQGHQRASSLTSSQASSEMRYTGAGSPALMGGALMSRDVSSYGGLAAGGRDSHGSGQSGAGHSARTANISAPVATENSLGWN